MNMPGLPERMTSPARPGPLLKCSDAAESSPSTAVRQDVGPLRRIVEREHGDVVLGKRKLNDGRSRHFGRLKCDEDSANLMR